MPQLLDRAVIRLSGEEVKPFLDGLVTNSLESLPAWCGLLTPQGKTLFDFIVWADPTAGSEQMGDDLLLDVAAGDAEPLEKRLSMYRLRRKIEIAVDETLAVHWAGEGDEGVADPRLEELGRRWLSPRVPAQAGTHRDDDTEHHYLEHRLRLNICEGDELKDLLWLECNAVELNGVSFTKGCFVGQENTARMNWRGKINRRLFVIEGAPDKARATFGDLGLSIVHARKDAVPEEALMPHWLAEALK